MSAKYVPNRTTFLTLLLTAELILANFIFLRKKTSTLSAPISLLIILQIITDRDPYSSFPPLQIVLIDDPVNSPALPHPCTISDQDASPVTSGRHCCEAYTMLSSCRAHSFLWQGEFIPGRRRHVNWSLPTYCNHLPVICRLHTGQAGCLHRRDRVGQTNLQFGWFVVTVGFYDSHVLVLLCNLLILLKSVLVNIIIY